MSTELVPVVPTELVDIRDGSLVPATAENAAELLAVARDYRSRAMNVVHACEAVLLEESRRLGTKTLKFPTGTATVTGGQELDWDVSVLSRLLAVGLPDERYGELVKTQVTYRVDARIAKQLEASGNPAYAEIIRSARSEVPKAWRVSIR